VKGWRRLARSDESGEPRTSGAGNPEFSLRYALFRNIEHETILSVGFGVELGSVGSKRVAEKVTPLTPALFFGKGFGDLPDSLSYLKPLAITGSFAVNNPANRRTGSGDDVEHNPTTLADSTILAVDLLPLTAGTYRVYWSVLAKDTHVTTGDFSFTVK
jgi:hypothetical protein